MICLGAAYCNIILKCVRTNKDNVKKKTIVSWMMDISVASLFLRHPCTDFDIFGFPILRHDQVYIPVVGCSKPYFTPLFPMSSQLTPVLLLRYRFFWISHSQA